jgi:hypothetical protein
VRAKWSLGVDRLQSIRLAQSTYISHNSKNTHVFRPANIMQLSQTMPFARYFPDFPLLLLLEDMTAAAASSGNLGKKWSAIPVVPVAVVTGRQVPYTIQPVAAEALEASRLALRKRTAGERACLKEVVEQDATRPPLLKVH